MKVKQKLKNIKWFIDKGFKVEFRKNSSFVNDDTFIYIANNYYCTLPFYINFNWLEKL